MTADTSKPNSHRFRPLTLPELLNGPADIDWLVEPIIPRGTAGILAGPSGVGKTWLLLDLALSVASGTPFLDKFHTNQGKVLIVDEENAELLLRIRLKKMLAPRGLNPEDLEIHFLVGKSVNFSPDRSGKPIPELDQFTASMKSLRPAMVIFDSLTRVHRANENSANEMAAVFANVKHLIDTTGAACLFSHHFNKSGFGSSKSGERIRGSSDIRAFCDYTLLVDATKEGTAIHHDKSRWSENIPSFFIDFSFSEHSALLTYAGRADNGKKTTGADIWLWIFTQLLSGQISRPALLEKAANQNIHGTRTMDKVLKQKTKEGLLEHHPGKPVCYSLTAKGLQAGQTDALLASLE